MSKINRFYITDMECDGFSFALTLVYDKSVKSEGLFISQNVWNFCITKIFGFSERSTFIKVVVFAVYEPKLFLTEDSTEDLLLKVV